jgi:hypothetical protein
VLATDKRAGRIDGTFSCHHRALALLVTTFGVFMSLTATALGQTGNRAPGEDSALPPGKASEPGGAPAETTPAKTPGSTTATVPAPTTGDEPTTGSEDPADGAVAPAPPASPAPVDSDAPADDDGVNPQTTPPPPAPPEADPEPVDAAPVPPTAPVADADTAVTREHVETAAPVATSPAPPVLPLQTTAPEKGVMPVSEPPRAEAPKPPLEAHDAAVPRPHASHRHMPDWGRPTRLVPDLAQAPYRAQPVWNPPSGAEAASLPGPSATGHTSRPAPARGPAPRAPRMPSGSACGGASACASAAGAVAMLALMAALGCLCALLFERLVEAQRPWRPRRFVSLLERPG